MTDSELYVWVSGWRSETAHHLAGKKEIDFRQSVRIMAEQYRLDEKLARANIKAMRFAAILSVVGTLVGAVVGALLTK